MIYSVTSWLTMYEPRFFVKNFVIPLLVVDDIINDLISGFVIASVIANFIAVDFPIEKV